MKVTIVRTTILGLWDVISTRARERHEPELGGSEGGYYATSSSFASAAASSPNIWAPTEHGGVAGEDDLTLAINPIACTAGDNFV